MTHNVLLVYRVDGPLDANVPLTVIGSAIYEDITLMNHSCAANTTRFYQASSILQIILFICLKEFANTESSFHSHFLFSVFWQMWKVGEAECLMFTLWRSFYLVEGSLSKSSFLIGFFSAFPSPSKIWIWDGDRASAIFLSFGEEITASESWLVSSRPHHPRVKCGSGMGTGNRAFFSHLGKKYLPASPNWFLLGLSIPK